MNRQKPTPNYAKLLGPEAIPDKDVTKVRHMEEDFAASAHDSLARRSTPAERAATRRFRLLMATLMAATVGASAEVVNLANGHPAEASKIESVIPGFTNSGLDKNGNVISFRDHPAGAVIETIAPNGQQAEGFVAWRDLTKPQQSEAMYEQTHQLESDQP
jgi:hypothetical protein